MQVKYEFSHSVDTVYKTITDPEFLKQRALTLGSLDASCTVDAGKVNLMRKREINVPAVMSAFLKDVQIATTEETWSQSGEQYTCQNSTEIDGAPLSITGQVTLIPSANGCTLTADFNTKARIMLGKKTLQTYAGKTIAKEIELECEYTAKHLA